MKVIVAHNSPDLDAITSVWLLKRFFAGWHEARVEYVPAGSTKEGTDPARLKSPIERIDEREVIHVDTGLGPLDHHQTSDQNVSAASLTWDFVKNKIAGAERWEDKKQAIGRMVNLVVMYDHFQEVFFENPSADYHEFSFDGIIEGLKLQESGNDEAIMSFGMQCLDALLHNFENRLWAEREIAQNGVEFNSQWGKGIGFETVNDDVLKVSQKMGYMIVLRKDPRKGYVRIKARPTDRIKDQGSRIKEEVDLTKAYERLKEMDPHATWFLHVSKKMLLNGTTKNPKMVPSNLSLNDIIKVLEST